MYGSWFETVHAFHFNQYAAAKKEDEVDSLFAYFQSHI